MGSSTKKDSGSGSPTLVMPSARVNNRVRDSIAGKRRVEGVVRQQVTMGTEYLVREMLRRLKKEAGTRKDGTQAIVKSHHLTRVLGDYSFAPSRMLKGTVGGVYAPPANAQ